MYFPKNWWEFSFLVRRVLYWGGQGGRTPYLSDPLHVIRVIRVIRRIRAIPVILVIFALRITLRYSVACRGTPHALRNLRFPW